MFVCDFLCRTVPVGPDQLLLRGAMLKNTHWIFGISYCYNSVGYLFSLIALSFVGLLCVNLTLWCSVAENVRSGRTFSLVAP